MCLWEKRVEAEPTELAFWAETCRDWGTSWCCFMGEPPPPHTIYIYIYIEKWLKMLGWDVLTAPWLISRNTTEPPSGPTNGRVFNLQEMTCRMLQSYRCFHLVRLETDDGTVRRHPLGRAGADGSTTHRRKILETKKIFYKSPHPLPTDGSQREDGAETLQSSSPSSWRDRRTETRG